MSLVSAERIRSAFDELGNASGPLADVLVHVEAILTGAMSPGVNPGQRDVRSATGAPLQAVYPHMRPAEMGPL